MIQWRDEFLIGIEEIDTQHQKLFDIANDAYDLIKNDMYVDKYDRIVAILQELKEYTLFHFKTEEEYMMKIKYKKIFTQKIQHDNFIEEIDGINLKELDCNQDKYLIEILDFIVNWISDHILITDKQITSVE